MSRLMTAVAASLAAMALAPAASMAGGFATAGLSSLPEDVRPGGTWVVDVTVLAHGITPVEGVGPRVRIAREGPANGPVHSFAARATGRDGVYRARVEFSTKGFWAISVYDDYAGVHEFGGVDIGDERTSLVASTKFRPLEAQGPPAPPASASGEARSGVDLGLAIGIAALAGIVVAAVVASTRRMHPRPSPASG